MKKLIVLLLATGAITGGYAQEPKTKNHKLISPRDSLFTTIVTRNSPSTQAKLVNVLHNGAKVYVLPLDRMFCIVPDTSFYNYRMPVLKGKITGFMPNAVPRVQLIPNNRPAPIR